MATRNEKLFGSFIGVMIGGFIGSLLADREGVENEDRWKYVLRGAAIGGFSGYGAACLLDSKNNTVNYQLYNGKKLVYHGITYDHRIDNRNGEHQSSGKLFTKMIVDVPKPRVEALQRERALIKRDKPKYNIQYNY